MGKSAFSLYVFSIYMLVLGVLLVVVPNLLLPLFNMAETHEVWIRIVGMFFVIVGFLDLMAARNELLIFIRWTVFVRLAVPVFLIVLIALGMAPPILILFGAIDAAAAIWTAVSLRNDKFGKSFLVD